MDHSSCAPAPGRLFCSCGKLVNKRDLHSVRFVGFHGAESTSPKIEEFWATGDPAVFAQPGAPDFQG